MDRTQVCFPTRIVERFFCFLKPIGWIYAKAPVGKTVTFKLRVRVLDFGRTNNYLTLLQR